MVSTKNKIIDVSIELFSQNGYVGTTMREIAAEVGIKAGSLYNHFAAKEEILKEIINQYKKNWFGKEKWIEINDNERLFNDEASPKEITDWILSQLPGNDKREKKIFRVIYFECLKNQDAKIFFESEIIRRIYFQIKECLAYLTARDILSGSSLEMEAKIFTSLVISHLFLESSDIVEEKEFCLEALTSYQIANLINIKRKNFA